MTIVHVVRSAVYGGVENHVYALCRRQRAAGARVVLVSLVDCEIRRDFLELGIETHRLVDTEAWSWRVAACIVRLRRLLRAIGPDVVHLHGVRPIFGGSIAARLARVPAVVSTLHGSYRLMAMDGSGRYRRGLLLAAKAVHWTGFALSDRIVVDCERLKDEVRRVYRGLSVNCRAVMRRKVRVAYNGIDPDAFLAVAPQPALRQDLGIAARAVVIGTVSRLDEPKKGLAILIRAVHALAAEGRDVHALIAGEGWALGPLRRHARELGVEARVHFLGYREDLLEVYGALDVFVLPSLSEGFPTVNLEAMASSLPVVTTDVGGAAEAVIEGVTGHVVPPGDAGALAAAIARLCDSGESRRAMGCSARREVRARFGHDAMVERVGQVYAEALGKTPSDVGLAGVRETTAP